MPAEEWEAGPEKAQELDEIPQQYGDIGWSNHIDEQAMPFHVRHVERLVHDCVIEHEQRTILAPDMARSVHENVGAFIGRWTDVVQDPDACT